MTLLTDTVQDVRVYRDTKTGKLYPSTSAVLDLLFPSKMAWIDEAALKEGELCHAQMRLEILDYLTFEDWIPHDGHHPRVRALVRYLNDYNFVPIESEKPRASDRWGHAGTPDALLKRGSAFVVPDWKFAESIDERYRYQCETYTRLYDELNPHGPAPYLFQVNRAGKVLPQPVKLHAKRWTLCTNALAVLQHRLR